LKHSAGIGGDCSESAVCPAAAAGMTAMKYVMLEHLKRYTWVLPVALYDGQDELLGSLEQKVIMPAEAKLKKIRG
jgi:hypothetical protein